MWPDSDTAKLILAGLVGVFVVFVLMLALGLLVTFPWLLSGILIVWAIRWVIKWQRQKEQEDRREDL